MFWKAHESEYPVLASVARDVLTTPASGSGVERLFNSARDICHYRRGSLRRGTIEDLMFMCTTRFDIQSDQLALVDEYLSTQDKHAKKEQYHAEQETDMFEPISDDEEDGPSTYTTPTAQRPSARALGKRRALHIDVTMQDHGDDDNDEIPLPDNSQFCQESSTQRRSSERPVKRPRDDGDFVYT